MRPAFDLLRRRFLTLTFLPVFFAAGLFFSGAVASETGAAAATATTLHVQATGENACAPAALNAPAGQVTIVFTNALDDSQSFGLVGGVTASPQDVRRGASATLTATLAVGTYSYWCGDDARDGMRGTLTVTASGGGGTTTAPPTTAPPAQSGISVAMNDDFFTPTALKAAAGQITVTVKNNGADDHTFTIGNLVNVVVPPGQTKTATFTATAGSYRYFCAYHGGMAGTLTVEGAAPPGTTTTTPATTTAPPPTTTGPAPSSADVTLSDFAFAPNTVRVAAGTVTLKVANTGQVPHTFTVDGLVDSQLVQPGQTKTMTFAATAGSYRIYCAAPGHADIGMTGTLVVGSGGGTVPPTTTTTTTTTRPPATGDVVAADFSFAPSTLTVQAGTVTLRVANNGKLPHTFTVDGLVNVDIPAGETRTVTFEAKPGSYRVYCAVSGHADIGMTGTLVVQEPGAPPPVPTQTTPGTPGGHAGHAGHGAPAARTVACAPRTVKAFTLTGALRSATRSRLLVQVDKASALRKQYAGRLVSVRLARGTVFAGVGGALASGLEPGYRVKVALGSCKAKQRFRYAKRVTAFRPAAPGTGSTAGVTIELRADAKGMPAFDKKSVTAPAGKVTLRLTNPSPLEHNVALAGHGAGKVVGKGGVSTVTAVLSAGTYSFLCAVPGHAPAGMKGTLTVK